MYPNDQLRSFLISTIFLKGEIKAVRDKKSEHTVNNKNCCTELKDQSQDLKAIMEFNESNLTHKTKIKNN